MHEHQKMVLAFHEKFGLTINKVPNIPTEKDIALRINLNMEETRELFESLLNDLNFDDVTHPQAEVETIPSSKLGLSRALVGIADACADLKYVVYGAAITWGLDLDYKEERVGAFGLGQIEKPSDYSIFKLTSIVNKGMEVNRRFIQACVKLKTGHAYQDLDEVKASLENMIEFTYAVERGAGIKIDPIFEEVQRSNMSKLWEDGTVHRRPEDGKIMKPPTYSPADIAGVLAKQL